MTSEHVQIGEVAERTNLSLRTIRYYEEVDLVVPSARSQGGFRLYSESDIARLELIKQMKPLRLQLDEMRELLAILESDDGNAPAQQHRLQEFQDRAEQQCRNLREQLRIAEEFAAALRDRSAAS
ncbi:MerR family transcriptional regulator [Salinifilum aidingensis]